MKVRFCKFDPGRYLADIHLEIAEGWLQSRLLESFRSLSRVPEILFRREVHAGGSDTIFREGLS